MSGRIGFSMASLISVIWFQQLLIYAAEQLSNCLWVVASTLTGALLSPLRKPWSLVLTSAGSQARFHV